MSTELQSFLFCGGASHETVGDIAARFNLSYETLARINDFKSSSDRVDGKLVTVPWAAHDADVGTSQLGKRVLANEQAVLDAVSKGLKATQAPARISHTPWQYDFAALGTVVSLSLSHDAMVLMTSEGVGAIERPLPNDPQGAVGLTAMVDRLCRALTAGLSERAPR